MNTKRSSKEIAEDIRRREKEYYDYIEEAKAKIYEYDKALVSCLQTKMREKHPDIPDYYLLKSAIKILKKHDVTEQSTVSIWAALDKSKVIAR
jgi:hypothetical protein